MSITPNKHYVLKKSITSNTMLSKHFAGNAENPLYWW